MDLLVTNALSCYQLVITYFFHRRLLAHGRFSGVFRIFSRGEYTLENIISSTVWGGGTLTNIIILTSKIKTKGRSIPHIPPVNTPLGRSEGSNMHLVISLGSLFKTHTHIHNRSYIIFYMLRRSSIQRFFLVPQGYIVVLYNTYLIQKIRIMSVDMYSEYTSLRTGPRLWLCLLYAYLAPIDNIIIVV